MAASIRDSRNDLKECKPVLLDRVEAFDCEINGAVLLPQEDGFISIGDDK